MPSNCASSLIAECEAVLAGVSMAKDLALKNILVLTDSKVVYESIISPASRGSRRIFPIINKIRRLATSFDEASWECSPHEVNRAAYTVASLAFRVVDLNRWASTPPPSLTSVLRNDGLPCPHGVFLVSAAVVASLVSFVCIFFPVPDLLA